MTKFKIPIKLIKESLVGLVLGETINLRPDIQTWVCEQLASPVELETITSRATLFDDGYKYRMTDINFVDATFATVDDALLFKLTWM